VSVRELGLRRIRALIGTSFRISSRIVSFSAFLESSEVLVLAVFVVSSLKNAANAFFFRAPTQDSDAVLPLEE
jgi:hypothetical protein